MASLTLSVSEDFKKQLNEFSWVNWSEVAREETIKKLIFENYIKIGTLTDEEWRFCERIDWHPADELPPKEEHVKELKKALKEPSIKYNSVKEFFDSLK